MNTSISHLCVIVSLFVSFFLNIQTFLKKLNKIKITAIVKIHLTLNVHIEK